MLHLRTDVAYFAGYLPEQFLRQRTVAQIYYSQREHVEHFLSNLKRIMPALENGLLVKTVPYLIKFLHQLMLVTLKVFTILPCRQRSGFKHLGNQHRMMGSQRAAAFSHYIRLPQTVLLTGINY